MKKSLNLECPICGNDRIEIRKAQWRPEAGYRAQCARSACPTQPETAIHKSIKDARAAWNRREGLTSWRARRARQAAIRKADRL